jgi:hypothetical protein
MSYFHDIINRDQTHADFSPLCHSGIEKKDSFLFGHLYPRRTSHRIDGQYLAAAAQHAAL